MAEARINGARLWYEVSGHGRPVLMHHGYTASRANWIPAARRLAGRCQVILMECRGAGASEHTPGGYRLEQYARDAVGLLDHLGLAAATFAGHSMGGGVGYVLGLEHAERLDGLVLMAPVPADGTSELDPALRERRRQMRRNRDREAMRALYRAMRLRPDVETDAWFESRIEQILSCSDGHFEDSARAMDELRLGARLGAITTPTLVIAGAVDQLLPANLGDFLRLPNATLEVFSRAGHEVALHEPEGVARAIADFLEHGVVRAADLKAAAVLDD